MSQAVEQGPGVFFFGETLCCPDLVFELGEPVVAFGVALLARCLRWAFQLLAWPFRL